MKQTEIRVFLMEEISLIQRFDGISIAIDSPDSQKFRIMARYSDSDYLQNQAWDQKNQKLIEGCFLSGFSYQNPEWMITNHSGVSGPYFYVRKKRMPFERFMQSIKESRESDFLWLLFHPEVSSGLFYNK